MPASGHRKHTVLKNTNTLKRYICMSGKCGDYSRSLCMNTLLYQNQDKDNLKIHKYDDSTAGQNKNK